MTNEQYKEKGLKIFSLALTLEDFKKLLQIRKNMKFSTTQQAVKYLLYNSVTLQDYEKITLE
jgi:hypothetical protein